MLVSENGEDRRFEFRRRRRRRRRGGDSASSRFSSWGPLDPSIINAQVSSEKEAAGNLGKWGFRCRSRRAWVATLKNLSMSFSSAQLRRLRGQRHLVRLELVRARGASCRGKSSGTAPSTSCWGFPAPPEGGLSSRQGVGGGGKSRRFTSLPLIFSVPVSENSAPDEGFPCLPQGVAEKSSRQRPPIPCPSPLSSRSATQTGTFFILTMSNPRK